VGSTNLVVEAGAKSVDELIDAATDGIFVMGVTGLHSGVNPITGQFSVGATGRRIEGGRLTDAVREFTIASDLVTMLGQVQEVGRESRWLPFGGSAKASAMLIGEMAIGGR
jgi:PmbA protein